MTQVCRCLSGLLLLNSLTTATYAAQQVYVVVGKDAPKLEQFAAEELQQQLQKLFDAEVTILNTVPEDDEVYVLLGSPQTNPALKAAVGDAWPKLSDQGIVLRAMPAPVDALVVGGGSPVATLWAVYELGHRFGIRYLLRGDIYPEKTDEPDIERLDVVMEPTLRTRTWRTVNDLAIGPESWGLADHKKLLLQLAKMKFNRVMLSIHPWQPFVHYEFNGVQKQTAMLWSGERLRVDGDTPGKFVFGGATVFENPDFAGKVTYQEMTEAGIAHARGIITAAQELGMNVGLSIRPAEFTREFAEALPGAQDVHQLKNLTIRPGPKQGPHDPLIKELVASKLRAYIETYPTIDALYIGMPEFPDWSEQFEASWDKLSEGASLGDLTLDGLLAAASKRDLTVTGEDGIRAIKGNIVPLAFFKALFENDDLLMRPAGGNVELVICRIDPALFPVLDQVIPDGASALNFVDYTARRVVENRELLASLPANKVRSNLILTLADDKLGIFPQSNVASIHELVTDMRQHDWDGFSTRFSMLAELDPMVHYLSRASFDADVTPRSAHDDLFGTLCGKQAPADRLWLTFQHIEEATALIDKNDIEFGSPVEGMMMKHYQPAPEPEWWARATELYTQAMIELYRANDAAHPSARPLIFYYAKRGEYVLEYLGAVQAVRRAALAKEKGDQEETISQLEAAVESLYNAIDTLSDVVRDQSDRGLIAVLANHAYRPLVAEYERMLDE